MLQARGSLLTFLVSVLTFMTLVGGFSPLLEEMKVNFLSFFTCTLLELGKAGLSSW